MSKHSNSASSHEEDALRRASRNPVRCAVMTVSDTRTSANDIGGNLVVELLGKFNHIAAARALVKDDANAIASQLEAWLSQSDLNAILLTGGTGISKRDTTIEVVRRYITHELEGFGELFRMLSFQHVKAAAMMSRAVGGLVASSRWPNEMFIFAMPGSPNAVQVAISELIGPQLAHMVWERKK